MIHWLILFHLCLRVSGNVCLYVFVWWQSVSSTQHGHPRTAAEVFDPIRESECLLIFWHWEGNRQSYPSNVQWLRGLKKEWVLTECHLQFSSYSSLLQLMAFLLAFILPKISFLYSFIRYILNSLFFLLIKKRTREIETLNEIGQWKVRRSK